MLFVLYTQPISCIIHQCHSDLHKFWDDTQLFSSALSAAFGKSFLDPEYSFAAVPRITWTGFVKQQTFVQLRTDSVGLGSTNTQTINVHPVKNGLQTLASPCLVTLLLSFCLPPSISHYKCDCNSCLFLSFISDWLLHFPPGKYHFRSDGPTSNNTEQLSSADLL